GEDRAREAPQPDGRDLDGAAVSQGTGDRVADEPDEDEVIFVADTDLFWDLYALDLEVVFTPEEA
ncbi:MAG TPA: hypothetical protein VFH56_10330, partial [Acidimicrobiales bacterium]|nr:hypothetical protein [Acidimicrobiales bacterium]